MPIRYAYSYDREDYTGSFETSDAAFEMAVKSAEGLASPPTTIYIGQIQEGDPQVCDHAEQIVQAMNQRAHVDFGKAAEKYLRKVTKSQIKELDEALAQTLLAWLKKNNLMPRFQRVIKVRELPVNTPVSKIQPPANDKEICEIGSDQPEA